MQTIENVALNNYSGKSIPKLRVTKDGRFEMYGYKWQIKFRQPGVFALINEDGEPVERYEELLEGMNPWTQSFYLLYDQEDMEAAVRKAVTWIANYV